jgi:hypothetical protein
MGSWFGDWNLGDSSRNNLLRSFLGIQDYGLVALWGYREWPMTRFGLGRPIGASQTGSFDYRLDFEFAPTPFHAAPRRTTEILGDPTLRWTPPSSPCGLVGVRLGGDVTLTWRTVEIPGARYHLLYSTSGVLGPYVSVTPATGISQVSFVHASAPATQLWYQVRTAALTATGSGSFWNVSQATTCCQRAVKTGQ